MRIGHLSDFHLRCNLKGTSSVQERRSRDMPELIDRAVGRLCQEQVDCVVVTGDLVDHPFENMNSIESLDRGEADLQLVHTLLDQFDCPVFVVYGNHDHPLLFRRVFPFRNDSLTMCDYQFHCFYDEEGVGNIPERVGRQLERFNNALSDTALNPQIHIQHYVLHPKLNDGYPHTYINAESLINSAHLSGKVTLFLSGHFHSGVDLVRHKEIFFATAPAFCQPPHPFRIYEIINNSVKVDNFNTLG